MKIIFYFLVLCSLCACGSQSEPRTLTKEQSDIIASMPVEQGYYVKMCYLESSYRTFSGCLEEKQKYYVMPQVTQQANSTGTDLALGMLAGHAIASSSQPSHVTVTQPSRVTVVRSK